MAISSQQPPPLYHHLQLLHNPTKINPITQNQSVDDHHQKPEKQKQSIMRVCFSFAAYAKSLIQYLSSNLHIPIQPGLSDEEFHQIETSFGFKFPPDLRSILREGTPVGAGFPNWRSASKQQLQLVINLPKLKICQAVRDQGFWMNKWGVKPRELSKAVNIADMRLRAAPVLIPIYKSFYIPSHPDLAGNPVFEIGEDEIKIAGFDVGGFFAEFSEGKVPAPAWRAREARRIEMWTEMAEERLGGSGGWWWGGRCGGGGEEIGLKLEEAFWSLRNAGWREEEVKEMMGMDGGDVFDAVDHSAMDGEDEMKRRLCQVLTGSGWCDEDVIYALDLQNGIFDFDFEIFLLPEK